MLELKKQHTSFDFYRDGNSAETVNWVDRGCEVSDRCMKCFLPNCKMEEPLKVQTRKARDGVIKYLALKKFFSRELIVIVLNVQASNVRHAFTRKETLEELEPYYSNEWLIERAGLEFHGN